MNNKIKLLFLILFICIFISNVTSLGITPGRTTLDFKPGLEKNVEVTVINSQKTDIEVFITTRGELASSIVLNQKSLKMSSSEEEKNIGFSIKLPQTLSPGLHVAEVVVSQKMRGTSKGDNTIGAEIAVATQVAVYVPYPGQYLDAQLLVSGDEKKKTFTVSMVNRGTEEIKNIKAEITVYDLVGNEVKKMNTNTIKLGPSEKGEIFSTWSVNVPNGKYVAKAVIDFDSKQIKVEKEFEVGEFVLDLLQIFVKDFKLGEIAKFNLVVKNKWNEPITRAYAEMRVFDKEMKEIADVKSATYDIPPETQTDMVYYWDTKNIAEGLYNANVILFYEGKKTQQDLKLDVKSNKIDVIGLGYAVSSESSSSKNGLVTILTIIIVFLILLNVLWFLVLRKRKMRKH